MADKFVTLYQKPGVDTRSNSGRYENGLTPHHAACQYKKQEEKNMSNNKNQTVKTEQTAGQKEAPAVFDVKIHAIHLSGAVLADASATYNGCFAIRGLKLVNDAGSGPYVSMPGYQAGDRYVDICSPNTPEVYERLKEAVIDAYRQKLTQMQTIGVAQAEQQEQKDAPERVQLPTTVSARINTLRDGNTLADITVDIDGAFTVAGAKIMDTGKGPFISMPSYKTARGYSDACFPCTSEFHEQLKNDVLGCYRQTLARIQDQTAAIAPAQAQSEPAMAVGQTM